MQLKLLPFVLSTLVRGVVSRVNLRQCKLHVMEFVCLPDDSGCLEIGLDCESYDGRSYSVVGAPEEWISHKIGEGTLVSGESVLFAPSDLYAGDAQSIVIPDADTLDSLQIRTRTGRRVTGLAAVTGNISLLIVRVVATDSVPSYSADVLSDKFFGTGGDAVTLHSQMSDCSYGQLNVMPPTGPHIVSPGVVEVDIGIPMEGNSDENTLTTVINAAVAKIFEDWGVDVRSEYDKVAFVIKGCKPNKCPWGAYAAVNGWYAVFKGQYATMSTIQMHIFGRLLGLNKSGGINKVAHNDYTCSMGVPLYDDDGRMCFNAAKNRYLGWYANAEVTPGESNWDGKMIGIAEWDNGAHGLPVSVQLSDTNNSELIYVAFNRATGINGDNAQADDQVTVTSTAAGAVGVSPQSWLLATLGAGEEHELANGVKVRVCEIDIREVPGWAHVLIYTPGSGEGLCPEPTSKPTLAPTVALTATPTATPNASHFSTSAITCAGLNKKTCLTNAQCTYTKDPQKTKLCLPRIKKYEHDCSQYASESLCTAAKGLCDYVNGACVHMCDGGGSECRGLQANDGYRMCRILQKITWTCVG